jgi:hypothetical protein
MWFRIALALGCTVREAQERVNSAEFAEWSAYYAISPWDGYRGDVQAALIARTCVQLWSNHPGGCPDLFPKFWRPPKTADEIKAVVESVAGRGTGS